MLLRKLNWCFYLSIISLTNCIAQSDSIQLNYILKEVHVNGEISNSHFSSDILDSSSSWTSISLNRQYLMNSFSTNAADVLSSSGKISVQKSQQGGGSPVLNGFEANKIALILDGVKMNNLIYRGGHLQNIISVDHFFLDKIEVLSGPSSLIAGSDAIGGTILMQTRQLTYSLLPKFFSESQLVLNSANTHSGFSTLFGKRSSKMSWWTGISLRNFNDLNAGSKSNFLADTVYGLNYKFVDRLNGIDTVLVNSNPALQRNSAYKQLDAISKIGFISKSGWINEYGIQFSTSTNIPRYDRLADSSFKWAEWYYGPQNRFMMDALIKKNFIGKCIDKFFFKVAYQHIDESRYTRRFNNLWLDARKEFVDVFSGQIELVKQYKSQQFHYGLDAQLNYLNSTAVSRNINSNQFRTIDSRYPNGKNYMNSYGSYFFSQWQMPNMPKLLVNYGVRLNYTILKSEINSSSFSFPFDQINQNNISFVYNADFTYKLIKGLDVYLQTSSSFRTPNIDDLAKIFESNNDVIIVPNQELKPERANAIHLGIRCIHSNDVQFSFESFYIRTNQLIALQTSTFNGNDSILYNGNISQVYSTFNADHGYSTGLRSRFVISTKKMLLENVFEYTYGRLIQNGITSPLDHVHPFSIFMVNNYNLTSKIVLGWSAKYTAEKKIKDFNLAGEDNLQYALPDGMSAWLIFNAKSNIKLSSNSTFKFGVDNLLDTHYRVFASGISAAGRNYIIGLNVKF